MSRAISFHNRLVDNLRHSCIRRFRNVEVIETHISSVLLAGDLAYKIKKPLNLGFLDFSTLERRRFFCLEEVRLNGRPSLSRSCPMMKLPAGIGTIFMSRELIYPASVARKPKMQARKSGTAIPAVIERV